MAAPGWHGKRLELTDVEMVLVDLDHVVDAGVGEQGGGDGGDELETDGGAGPGLLDTINVVADLEDVHGGLSQLVVHSVDPVSGVRHIQAVEVEIQSVRNSEDIELDGFLDRSLPDVQYPDPPLGCLGETMPKPLDDVPAGDEEDSVSAESQVLSAQQSPGLSYQLTGLVVVGVAWRQLHRLQSDLDLPHQDGDDNTNHGHQVFPSHYGTTQLAVCLFLINKRN